MLIRPAIGDTDPIRYRRPTPDGQFSGNILGEAMRGSILDADPPAQGVNIAGRMTVWLWWGPDKHAAMQNFFAVQYCSATKISRIRTEYAHAPLRKNSYEKDRSFCPQFEPA